MIKKENLFVEFLLKKFEGNPDTKLQVSSCENFLIVKGETTYSEVLSINKISVEFSEKYPEYSVKNTIDLIDYKEKIEPTKSINLFFSKHSRFDFPQYFSLSDFPFGDSTIDKSIYFYFKSIFEKIPSSYPFDWIEFRIKKMNGFSMDFEIVDNYHSDHDGSLKSAILDSFDFNLEIFDSQIKKVDFETYILNPLDESIKVESKEFIYF